MQFMYLNFTEPACSARGLSGFLHKHPKLSFVMRVSFFYMALVMCSMQMLLAHSSNSQGLEDINVTVELQNENLKKLFKKIESQTGLLFAYQPQQVDSFTGLTLPKATRSVKATLDLALNGTSLSYRQVNNSVIIFREGESENPDDEITKTEYLKIAITGKVTDSLGIAMAGVNVIVKGTTTGTTTDVDGNYSIEAEENDVLVFSFIGYASVEMVVSNQTVINITMKDDATTLKEVVVMSTGFQDVPAERATGSFVGVNNEEFNRRVSPDVLSRLQGIASGLLFDQTSDNTLGISIRGRSTIYANTQPLIVVDNFVFSGTLNSINPNDIESITVLKDAAAASIWGARSGNGVIVITTKKGGYNKKTSFEFNSNVTIGQKPDLYYTRNFLKSSDFIDVEEFLFGNGFYNSKISNTTTRPPLSPVVEILALENSGTITGAEADDQINALRGLDVRNDYEKHFLQNRVHQQYSLNMSSGTEKSTHYLSVGYDKTRENLVGDDNNRVTANFSTTYKPIEKLEFLAGIYYSKSLFNRNGMTLSALTPPNFSAIYPYAQLADANGNPLPIIRNYRESFASNPPVAGLLDWQYYPLDELQHLNNSSNVNDTRLSAGVKYSILQNLSIDLRYQYLNTRTDLKNHNNQQTYFTRNLINQFSVISAGTVTGRNIPVGDIISHNSSNLNDNNFRAQVNYNVNLKKHTVYAIAGVDAMETKTEGNSSTIYGYDPNLGASTSVNFNTTYPNYPSGGGRIPGTPNEAYQTIRRFRSYFANASYVYNDRYTLSASARVDKSNLFGVETNQKSVPLWSTGVKWDIDKENFYNASWLPELKFRITYGYNGNTDPSLSAMPVGGVSSGDFLNNAPYAYLTSPGNPELKWEKIGMLNIAVDFLVLNGRIGGTIEYFHKNGKDIIGDGLMPSSTGWTLLRGNYANMKGNGFDLVLNTKNIISKIKWNTDIILSAATDEVTKIDGFPLFSNNILVEGRPVKGVYSYEWAGLDASGNPQGILDGTVSTDYNQIIIQARFDAEKYMFKPATPKFFGGIMNTVSLKNLSLSFNIVFKAGYYFRSTSISYYGLYNTWTSHSDFTKRWKSPGDENKTSVPSMIYPANINRDIFYATSEVLVEKGDHIRLQDIRLSYDLFRNANLKIPFEKLQLYVYMNNLGILWRANNKGIDPDFQTGPPAPRTISFGLRANF
jgi:TonB-linked SusC/RagA family outer membrane protein